MNLWMQEATRKDTGAQGANREQTTATPPALAQTQRVVQHALPTGAAMELLLVPIEDCHATCTSRDLEHPFDIAAETEAWVLGLDFSRGFGLPIVIPLYDCLIVWAPARAAAIGPANRLPQLEAAIVDFASVEAELRRLERQSGMILDSIDASADWYGDVDQAWAPEHRSASAKRYQDAVDVCRMLTAVAPLIATPPLHPPTLASQLGERLRERTRLAERYEFASHRAELAERVTEAHRQRSFDAGIARRQMGLEWGIIFLLVGQTVLLIVDLLSWQSVP